MNRSLLKIAIGTALFGLALGSAVAQDSAAYVGMKNMPRLSTADHVTGMLSSSHPIHVEVALRLRNEAQLDAFLANPNHPILSSAQFAELYSPTLAQAQQVAEHLIRSGFRNVTIAPNRLLVSADGSPREAATAFQVKMVHVLTQDGRDAYANSTDAKIPAELQGTVQAVLGLQTVHQGHTFAQVMKPDGFHTLAVTGHNPTNFAPIYTDSSLAAATAVPVGIVTEGKLTNVTSDLNSFTSANGLATVTTSTVNTNGTSTDTSGDVEWDLDSQDIVSMAGGVQKIIFYDIPSLSDANMTADFNAIVSANAVKIINVSIGECETDAKSDGSSTSDDTIFKQADAQGQSFSISSGDSGADECGTGGTTPSWPASSQYVVAVGGTSLNASTTTWTSEVVWNNLAQNNGATGGSPSTFEAMPSWQSGIGQNAGHTTRGVPDVAFDADPNSGAEIIVDGKSEQVGGTSLSSPLFVGTWARMLQAKGSTLGFAAPLIYADAAAHASTDFHDVTSGNNSGETAAAGWDYTTGFGSIIASSFVNNVGGTGGGGGTAPVASNGSVTTAANTPVNGTLSATGTAPLSFAVVASPAHGTVSITNASTGAFTYTPTSGFSGSDSFTFDASNSVGTSAAATESVTVTAASGSCATGYTSFTGSITQGNDVFEPNNTYYVTTVTGVNSGILSGPAGKDYDLYLYKWNGRAWRVVASSTGPTDSETINYNGSAGDYEWDIYAYSGSGTFQFCLKHP